jgi:N-acetylmuramoyl-L-alanine amidase
MECHKQWHQENKERKKEYKLKYIKQRKSIDPLFKLSINIRNLIGMSFNKQGWSKSSNTEKILGCNFETLQNHLIFTAHFNYGSYS